MDIKKLTKIISRVNNELKTEPFYSIESDDQRNKIFSNEQDMFSIKCCACEDTRRQNYQLKQ